MNQRDCISPSLPRVPEIGYIRRHILQFRASVLKFANSKAKQTNKPTPFFNTKQQTQPTNSKMSRAIIILAIVAAFVAVASAQYLAGYSAYPAAYATYGAALPGYAVASPAYGYAAAPVAAGYPYSAAYLLKK